jgi:hypothetical protein
MKRRVKIFFILIILLLLVGGVLLATQKNIKTAEEHPTASEPSKICFRYDHISTDTKPYDTSELVYLILDGDSVSGQKFGTQRGPEMWNGYQGTLIGTRMGNDLNLRFDYTIEGANQSEQELYTLSETALTKHRYQLIEQDGVLVPDLSTTPFDITYTPIDCSDNPLDEL